MTRSSSEPQLTRTWKVGSDDVGSNELTTSELGASSVDTSELAANAVTTAKITDDNVTFAKLEKAYAAVAVDVGVDGSGDGTAAIAFGVTFAATPAAVASINGTQTGYCNVYDVDATSGMLEVKSASETSATISCVVIGMEK